VRDLLAPEGTALIHTIGRFTPPGTANPWIRKYIFPGGYIPAASETLAALEPSGLYLTDLEVWRLHYARTLQHWNDRFQAARQYFVDKLGERFCRMWEFYLLASEASFRWGGLCVFHIQMSRQLDRLPLTRDYLGARTG
jgi:cyclopropane-fatty-acyl-phospholipid synthase